MKPWKTDLPELADLIFNSSDTDLNDLVQAIVATGKYDVGKLLVEITASVNNSFPLHLRSSVSEISERQQYLKEEVRAELLYYIEYAKQRGSNDSSSTLTTFWAISRT